MIDSSQSNLDIVGSSAADFLGTYTGAPIASGSFETSLGGVLEVALTPTTLELLSGSTLIPVEANSYLPGIPLPPDDTANLVSPDPASYSTIYAGVGVLMGNPLIVATRGLEFDIADGTPRSLAAGVVGAAVPDVALSAGEGHLNFGSSAISPIGSLGLMGSTVSSGAGTLSGSGPGSTLTLPIEFTIAVDGLISTTTTYSGTIVATQVPEPGTVSLVALASLAALGLRRPNRK
ncbi:MAG: PEP-CTERM sorting domain-containing protein [Cyanobacteria bacterium P01_F01_bin.3]